MHQTIAIRTKKIAVLGIMAALEILFANYLTIHTWNLKIGFSFLPIVVTAIFFGPVSAGIVGAVGDISGFLISPVGAFFPGFTLTAFLTGIIFGMFLYKKQNFIRVICAVLVVQLVLGLFLNTYFISFLYGTPFAALFISRIYQIVGMSVIEIAGTMLVIQKLLPALRSMDL